MLDMIRQLLVFSVAVVFIISCSVQRKAVKIESNDIAEVSDEDSLEYELETFDPKFETWYMIHNSPARYRSQQYYEGWNQRYVSAWNINASDPRRSWFFETIVGYEYGVDYGFELNHKLFYYFQYVENVLKIPIMSGGPNIVRY